MSIINEAFQALNILDEDMFDVNDDGIAKLKDFRDTDDEVETEIVIDPLAEDEEDLKTSYLGKAILNCIICQSKIYKDPSEVVISEDGDLANVGEICPYCQSSDGFKVIGQVAEFKPETEVETDEKVVDVDTTETEDETEDEEEDEDEEELDLDEALKTKKGVKKQNSLKEEKSLDDIDADADDKKEKAKAEYAKAKDDADADRDAKLKEDLQTVNIETDKERITVTSEPKAEVAEVTTEAEMVAPVSDETEAEFKSEDEATDESEDEDISEFDEETFDDLGESYLKKVYENVASYKTTSGSITSDNKTIKLEGLLEFKSGKKVKTNFIFEAKSKNKDGKVTLTGSNKQFAKGNKSFTLKGKKEKGKLISESLTYNYRARDEKSGASRRLYGRVGK